MSIVTDRASCAKKLDGGQHLRVNPLVAEGKYRSDIDGLRAVAVLSVIGFHAFPAVVVGGFVGVDVFFVISGFLISGIIFGALERDRFSFVQFYARRIRRIFPALILVLISAMVFGCLFLFPDELRMLGKHIFGSGLYSNNLFLWKEAGYFDASASQKPLLHLWSLGIEEQFYLTFPLVVWLLWRSRYRLPALIALCIVSFALNVLAAPHHATGAFYSPMTRAWELLIGVILSYGTMPKPKPALSLVPSELGDWMMGHSKHLRDLLSLTGIAMVASSLFIISSNSVWPGYLALLPTLGGAAIIAGGSQAWVNRIILGHPVVVYLGLISYPLYLWHWVLLSFAVIITSGDISLGVRAVLALCSIPLAALTYHFIELPIRKGGNLFPKAISLGLTMSVVAAAGLCIYLADGFYAYFPAPVQETYRDIHRLADISETLNCPKAIISAGVKKGLFCRSVGTGAPTSVVWGDSHAAAFFLDLPQQDQSNNWMLLGGTSCPPLVGVDLVDNNPDCVATNKLVLDYLRNTSSIKTVTLVFFDNYIQTESYAADHVARRNAGIGGIERTFFRNVGRDIQSKTKAFNVGLSSAVKALQASGKRVVIVIDNPELPYFPKKCLARNLLPAGDCRIPRAAVDQREYRERLLIADVAARHPGVVVFDPTSVFCNRDFCSPLKNGFLLYTDSHHLGQSGSSVVTAAFLGFLKNAWH
jgi:peptidoglycan/LPS O-acetylase OafA/YrhL